MLKKLLKSCLAIAAVCAFSSAAFAEAKVSANVNTSFGLANGLFKGTYYGQIVGMIPGEKVSGMVMLDTHSERGENNFITNVAWKVADSFTLKLGNDITPGSTGYVSDGGSNAGGGTLSYFGSHAGIADYVFLSEGLHLAVGLGSMNIYAGILEDDGTGSGMTPYAYFGGAFGMIKLTVGAKMNAGTDMGMVVAAKFDISKTMIAAVDYHMQGSATCPAASFQMKELGPGNLGIAMSMPSGYTFTGVNYGIELEPGAILDVFYRNTTYSDMGIAITKNF